MEPPEDQTIYEKIVASVTQEELDFMRIFGIDGVCSMFVYICVSLFVSLCVRLPVCSVRGAVSKGAVHACSCIVCRW